MDISVIGTGYVGLPVGVGLASRGHEVTCVDVDSEKIQTINSGNSPVHEEGVDELLRESVAEGKLKATLDTVSAVQTSEITLIAVGTPMEAEGGIDLSYVKQAAREVGNALGQKDDYHLVVVKSTVVPTTTEQDLIPILEEASGKTAGEDFGVCMNPEFLREGTALSDFMEPDRIVIGELNAKSGNKLEKMYAQWDAPVLRTSLSAAEIVKYTSNALLATKISFINEIGNLCKELGIDTYEVADAVGMDHRINRDFLNSGNGFGGSCFPKDVRALISYMQENDAEARMLESVIRVNVDQKTKMVEKLKQHYPDLSDKTVTVLGLSFKPGTDDIRESPAVPIIRELKNQGAKVKAHDPKAMENMRDRHHANIHYYDTHQEALKDSDAALIVTKWKAFDNINKEDLELMSNELIIEGMKTCALSQNPGSKEGLTWP